MVIYLPSFVPRFRCYGFLQDDWVAENCNTGQIAAMKGN
jgi:hypothetical protein